jgi:hypothetical protein
MTAKRKKKLNVDDELEELKAKIARLRGAMRAVEKLAKLNLRMTSSYMLKLEGE